MEEQMEPKGASSGAKTSAVEHLSAEVSDGRRRRSQRSREKIIAAMFRLIKDDDPYPSVVAIAKEAGVSKRTAFRHFSDLNSLIVEMSQQLKDSLRPIIYAPYKSEEWRDQLAELVDRRAHVFEKTMLVKQSADIRRYRSEFLMADYTSFLEQERKTLLAVLPTTIKQRKPLTAALNLSLSFQSWTQLRLQQGLSPKQAKAVMKTSVDALIKTL